ncbi:hypothetical protein PJK55_12570 [Exiguobacterium sp. MMG028]|uniref:hypothetical protein n=1 Tax=Exiguobacterium sp. MMG028 TaxID=3021979 RepID=UPI0022FF3B6B|nr:hypothetical protein [Exiguobacterium sp. MMG028]MDA5561568.1 hypothetical protein [Exiguobacterium sp. MMG028]
MIFYFLTTILSTVGLAFLFQSELYKDPIGTFLFAVLIAMGLSSFKQLFMQASEFFVERRNQKRIKRVVERMHSTTRKRST